MYIAAQSAAREFGGTEKWTALLLRGLQERGHRVGLYCNHSRLAERFAAYGIESRVLRIGGDLMLWDAIRFAGALRRDRPDALLLCSFRKLWLGGLAAQLAGVPRVVTRIGISTDLPRRWKYRVALRRWVDPIVFNADGMREPFLAELPEVEPARTLTIYDGVRRQERTAPAGSVREALGVPATARLVGAIARLENRQKRFDRLLQAVALLPPHVHCVLAGEGGDRPRIESLAAELGIRERLHLLGYRTDVGNVLDALDVFVISSDFEGLANSMLEALASGVPVVSTAVSGAAEALDPFPDGSAPGEVVDFTADALAAAVRRLLEDPERYRSAAEAGVRRWQERFEFGRMLDRYEALFAGDGSGTGLDRPPDRSPEAITHGSGRGRG